MKAPKKKRHKGTDTDQSTFLKRKRNQAVEPEEAPFLSRKRLTSEIQPKSEIVEDPIAEKEADRAGERFMRMPVDEEQEKPIQRKAPSSPEEEGLQRKKDLEEEPQLSLKAKTKQTHAVSNKVSQRLESRKGKGEGLSPRLQAQAVKTIGEGALQANIHRDPEALQLAQDLNAKGFAYGSDVYLGRDYADMKSPESRRVLGHELGHVREEGREYSYSQIRESPYTLEEWKSSPEGKEYEEEKKFLSKKGFVIEEFEKHKKGRSPKLAEPDLDINLVRFKIKFPGKSRIFWANSKAVKAKIQLAKLIYLDKKANDPLSREFEKLINKWESSPNHSWIPNTAWNFLRRALFEGRFHEENFFMKRIPKKDPLEGDFIIRCRTELIARAIGSGKYQHIDRWHIEIYQELSENIKFYKKYRDYGGHWKDWAEEEAKQAKIANKEIYQDLRNPQLSLEDIKNSRMRRKEREFMWAAFIAAGLL